MKKIFKIVIYCLYFTFLAQYIQAKNITEADSARLAFDKNIAAAKNDSIKKIAAYYNYAEYFDDNEGDYEAAAKQLEIALRISQNIKNDKEIARVGNYLAYMYVINGDFNESNNAYLLALKSAKIVGDPNEIAKISMNIANNYRFMGDYDNAIKYGLSALKTKESKNNQHDICYHYVSVANIFRETSNYDKWYEYLMKAYKMKNVKDCATIGDIAKIYNGLGGYYNEKKEYKKAMLYYDTLYTVCKKNNHVSGINTALINIAQVYQNLKNIPKALEYAEKSEKYFTGNPYEIIFNNNFKATLYQEEGNYKTALELANENIKKEELDNYSGEKQTTLNLLYNLNFKLHNYNAAFMWSDSLRNYENKIRDEDVRKSIEELETKYETEQKQQQIELLTTENKLKNQRIKVGIILLGILFIVIILILYILQIRRKQAELVQTDLQQKVLRSQMNPHFMFNVLGSIQNYIQGNDAKKASNYLSQFASLTRATLEYSASETILLSDEIEMLTDYIELEKMRKPGKFDYKILKDDDLETDLIKIPPMMVQPFVENAIKHGFSNIDYTGLLTLSISDNNEWIEFIVEDNGKGLDSNKKSDHRSMAMEIFEKRRRIIEVKHKKEFKFKLVNIKDIEPEKSGIKITLNIPILNED